MDGVTILNQFVHEGAVLQPWTGIGLGLIFFGIFGLLIFGIGFSSSPAWCKIMSIICAICCIIGLCIRAFGPREEVARYQVIINDEVNFNDFSERYEIIKQEGLIYTIEEREP